MYLVEFNQKYGNDEVNCVQYLEVIEAKKTFMSKNAVKENTRSTAQGKVWSFLLGAKKGTNQIQKVLNKGDETKRD